MPNPLAIAGIQAGGQVVGDIINAFTTGANNRKQRQWAEQMYARQRQDALDDWNRQNEYNSPIQMMARLKSAGINPNLAFGELSSGNAGQVRSAEAPAYRPEAPRINVGQAATAGVMGYYDAQIKNATVDNLAIQNRLLQMDLTGKAVDIGKKVQDTVLSKTQADRNIYDLEMLKATRQLVIDAMQANLDNTRANTAMSLSENERRAAMQQPTLEKMAQEIINLKAGKELTDTQVKEAKARIDLMAKDGTLKDWEIKLNQSGLTKGDAAWQRLLADFIRSITSKGGVPGISPSSGMRNAIKGSPLDYLLPFGGK